MVKFISYNGEYPCLCYGTLKIEINKRVYELENVLVSGGGVSFDDNYIEDVMKGEWVVDLKKYQELKPYRDEITKVVNENVEYGCCGGCV